MKRSAAEILREYGPFPGAERVNGVTYDGRQIWFASGDRLNALDPASGTMVRLRPGAALAAGPGRRSAGSSAMLFHSPQASQRPAHLALTAPQAEQR